MTEHSRPDGDGTSMTATKGGNDDVDEAEYGECFAAVAAAVTIGMRQHFCGSTLPSAALCLR